MHRTILRGSQSVLRDVRAAAEIRGALSSSPYKQRLSFLRALRDSIMESEKQIMEANKLDCDAFTHQQHHVATPSVACATNRPLRGSHPFDTRSTELPSHGASRVGVHTELSPLRIKKLLDGINGLMRIPDPIAPSAASHSSAQSLSSCASRPIVVQDVPVPLGFVGVLSRYRPRMTLDAVSMCILSGNAVLIDGGSAVARTNHALMHSIRRALAVAGIPSDAVVHVEANVSEPDPTALWLRASDHVDVAVVCGTEKLFRYASENAAIPLIKAVGRACSLYVDKSAHFETALEVVLNAKFQRPVATNAISTLILHEAYPKFRELLHALKETGALLLGDTRAQELAPTCIHTLVNEEIYSGLTEGHADLHRVLCVRTVRNLSQVVYFLDLYGSKQSDGIIATDEETIAEYCRRVDCAVVMVNASTRLSSGKSLGRGVDLAIATSKVHSRGPLTISAFTTRKIVVRCLEPGGALRT